MLQINEKKCAKCKEIKPLAEYYKNSSCKDGFSARCKVCKRKSVKEYRLANLEAIEKRNKEYRELNKDKISKRDKEWREKNKKRNASVPPEYTGEVKFKCRACKQELPDTSFSRDNHSKSGFRDICKKCDCERIKRRIMEQPSGIYSILNKVNNRIYIGQAIALSRRKTDHLRALRKGKHQNKPLQEDYNEHGFDAFEFEVIEECLPDEKRSSLSLKEMQKIVELHTEGRELYNLLILDL